jgi:C1A family cysteine protease
MQSRKTFDLIRIDIYNIGGPSMAVINTKKYGWRPSRPDHRDLKYHAVKQLDLTALTLPKSIDMEGKCPVVYNQYDLGSCTANAGGGLSQFLMMKLGKWVYRPSRLAIYYWERVLEGTANEDSGASIRDCMKVMSGIGVPPEHMWEYDISKFKQAPPKAAYDFAQQHKVGQYSRLNNTRVRELKHCLATGYPFIFGFSVYDSFESDVIQSTGILPMPGKYETLLGGHAVMAVGYDDDTKLFKIRNSYGPEWGKRGYFFMPYDFITDTDLASDFWTAQYIA